MWNLFALIGGILIGLIASAVFAHTKTIGSLRVVHSDPSAPPYLFLEVEKNLDVLKHGRLIVLRVRRENFLSHE